MRLLKSSFHFGFAAVSLLLVAMAQAGFAQQSADAPRGPSRGCQQIAVIGAVRTPRRVDAPLRLRLLEVLGRVGGPSERAGKTVRIVHTCSCSPCDKPEAKAGDISEYNLADVLRGRENGNPFLVPGDLVIVPEAASVFVMGTWRETQIVFVQGMTVTRAIAVAGGLISSSALTTVRIYRTSSNGPRAETIMINLRAITKGGAEDPLLKPWDIVQVSDDQGNFRRPRPLNPIWDPPLVPRKDSSAL